MTWNFNRALQISPQNIRKSCYAFVVMTMLLSAEGWAMGEKYAGQGHALAAEIYKELIRRDYCSDPGSCNQLLPMFGGHGNRVNFSTYGIGEKNRKALGVVIDLLIQRGIIITSGVPIKLVAYDRPHEDYVNQGFFRAKEPILTLEINK